MDKVVSSKISSALVSSSRLHLFFLLDISTIKPRLIALQARLPTKLSKCEYVDERANGMMIGEIDDPVKALRDRYGVQDFRMNGEGSGEGSHQRSE